MTVPLSLLIFPFAAAKLWYDWHRFQLLSERVATARDRELLKWERLKFAAVPIVFAGIMVWAESDMRHLPWLTWPAYLLLGVGVLLGFLGSYNAARIRAGL